MRVKVCAAFWQVTGLPDVQDIPSTPDLAIADLPEGEARNVGNRLSGALQDWSLPVVIPVMIDALRSP